MRVLKGIFVRILITSLIASCSSSDDSEPQLTERDIQLNLLAKTWETKTVELDNKDISDRFVGFTLTFTASQTYSSTPERGNFDVEPFKPTGTWDFTGGDLSRIIRDDGVEMVISVSETSLILDFEISSPNGGRVAGLGGYEFSLSPQ